MSLNNVKAVGDDQDWKAEVERDLKKLKEDRDYAIQQLKNILDRQNS